jgi:hypothetical protein
MSSDSVKKALDGTSTYIGAYRFRMEKKMYMDFEGQSCSIINQEGKVVKSFDETSGKIEKEVVEAGFECHVLKAYIKFYL